MPGRAVRGQGRSVQPPYAVSVLCLVPPQLIGDLNPLTNISATLHSPLTLLCEATGVPPPGVRWFRGEEPISPGEDTYLLAGEVPARGASGYQVWPSVSASVYHMSMTSDPLLPGLVGITTELLVPQECDQKHSLGEVLQEKQLDLSKSGKDFWPCSPPED